MGNDGRLASAGGRRIARRGLNQARRSEKPANAGADSAAVGESGGRTLLRNNDQPLLLPFCLHLLEQAVPHTPSSDASPVTTKKSRESPTFLLDRLVPIATAYQHSRSGKLPRLLVTPSYLCHPLANLQGTLRHALGGMPEHQPFAAFHLRYGPAAGR